jgi:hypothetical protein
VSSTGAQTHKSRFDWCGTGSPILGTLEKLTVRAEITGIEDNGECGSKAPL